MTQIGSETEKLQYDLSSRSNATTIVEASVICFILCLSLTGNLLVFSAVWRNHRLRTVSNMFVIGLAVSDILMALLCMPYSLVTLIHGRWIFGYSFCRAHGFFVFTLGLASLHTMGLVAVNRFFCIVKSSDYQTKFSFRRTAIFIFVVWCNALLGSVPPLFFPFKSYAFQPGKAMCLYRFEANIPYTSFIETIFIGLPLSLITFCYLSVFRAVYKTNKVFAISDSTTDREELRAHVKETKITKTLAFVFLGFVCCWLPVSVIDYLDAINGAPVYKRQVYLTYGLLVYISSLMNPFIYGTANRAFRREYKAIIKTIFCCKNIHYYLSKSETLP